MYKYILILLLSVTFNKLNAQTDEQIINEILFDLFGLQHDTILIKDSKTKTFFEYDSVSFHNETGLAVPSNIISEWNDNEENEHFIAFWNELVLNKVDTVFDENNIVISKKPAFKCLTKVEVDLLFEQSQKRQKIYSISKILFDSSKENALFNFMIISRPGQFFSEMILIKKVFGKWKIIERFEVAMT